MIDPYSFQPKMLDEARALMRNGVNRLLIRSETGSGKTRMGSEMFKGCLQRQKTADFVVHRIEILEQTANTFQKQGIPFGIIAAGQHCGENELIKLCSIQTLVNMPPRKPFMLCGDEIHHISAKSYQSLDADFFIGLSATPTTPNGQGLGKWFTHMVNGPTIPELQAMGCLSQFRYFAPSIPDLSDVGIVDGDYNSADIDRIMRGKTIVGDIVRHWQRLAAGKLTIGFAPSISASKAYVEAFQAVGVTSAHIDGTTPKNERKAICEAFCNKDIMVLFNVAIMEEGFDVSAYGGDGTVECLINARPTKSLRLARQINGRVLRRKPYPAIILDHAGQFTRTGMPDDVIEWKLDTGAKNITRSGSTVPIMMCASCDLCFPPAAKCPYCGMVPVPQERILKYTEGQLVEIKRADLEERKKAEEDERLRLRREVGMAKTMTELLDIAKRRGYSRVWAEKTFAARRRKKK